MPGKKPEKPSLVTAQTVEKPSQKKKPKPKPVQSAAAKSSTPTPADNAAKIDRITEVLGVLLPKVDVIMKALKEVEKRGKSQARPVPLPLPPAPKDEGKGIPDIPDWLVKIGERIADNLTAPDTGSSPTIDKEVANLVGKEILREKRINNDIGEQVVKHMKKHGMKGILKFEPSE